MQKQTEIGFTLTSDPAHGPDATRKPVFNDSIISETERAKILEHTNLVEFEPEVWYHNMLDYAANTCEPVSPLWQRYAGPPGIDLKTSFAYYADREFNNERIAGLEKNVTNWHTESCDPTYAPRQFAMGIIRNDAYEPTIAFMHRAYCDELGISFSERMRGFGEVSSKVWDHMRRMFWVKWQFMVPRPAQTAARLYKGNAKHNEKLPQFASSHPNHPSWGAGHATCFFATLAECESHYGRRASNLLHQTADEGGVLRCDLFLHYPQDCAISHALVHAFIPEFTEV